MRFAIQFSILYRSERFYGNKMSPTEYLLVTLTSSYKANVFTMSLFTHIFQFFSITIGRNIFAQIKTLKFSYGGIQRFSLIPPPKKCHEHISILVWVYWKPATYIHTAYIQWIDSLDYNMFQLQYRSIQTVKKLLDWSSIRVILNAALCIPEHFSFWRSRLFPIAIFYDD